MLRTHSSSKIWRHWCCSGDGVRRLYHGARRFLHSGPSSDRAIKAVPNETRSFLIGFQPFSRRWSLQTLLKCLIFFPKLELLSSRLRSVVHYRRPLRAAPDMRTGFSWRRFRRTRFFGWSKYPAAPILKTGSTSRLFIDPFSFRIDLVADFRNVTTVKSASTVLRHTLMQR
jgi:hypothetical protein